MPNILSSEQVAEAKKRADEASEGPWVTHSMNDAAVYADNAEKGWIAECRWQPKAHCDYFEAKRNGHFIAAARTDVPALCDSHEALRAERDALRDVLSQIQWGFGGFTDCEGIWIPNMCPRCEQTEGNEHAPGCLVGLALNPAPDGGGTHAAREKEESQ